MTPSRIVVEHSRLLTGRPRTWALFIGMGLVAGLTGCKEPVQAVTAPQPIQVATVHFSAGSQVWSLTGTIKPRYETDLGFRVSGKVVERLVDVGQAVSEEQVIARLDPTDFRLSIESQQAELRAARSNLDQAAAAEVRYRTLLQEGHVAQAALDQKTAAADEARGRVARGERALELAQNQLAYSELKAGHVGVISSLAVEVGQVVAIGQTVARLSRLDEREAAVAVPEHMIEAVKASSAEAELWGSEGRRLKAHLRELAPQAEPGSRTYQARFSIEGAGEDVVLGRTATVYLTEPGAIRTAELPLAAVINDGVGAAVYVVNSEGSKVTRTPVVIKSFGQDRVVVSGGLTDGARVVTLGVHMLDDAKPVRVVETHAELR